jgi:putative pyoverdin transport system ATP-binding/permease protein
MSLLQALARESKAVVLTSALAAVGCAVSGGLLIHGIYEALRDPTNPKVLWIFGLSLVGTFFGRLLTVLPVSSVAERMAERIRKELAERLLSTPLAQLEAVGTTRVYTALVDDTFALKQGVIALPYMVGNAAVSCGALFYLFTIRAASAFLVVALIAVIAILFLLLMKRMMLTVERSKDSMTALFEAFRAVTDGTKELLLNSRRRSDYLGKRLAPAGAAVRRDSNAIDIQLTLALAIAEILYSALIVLALLGERSFLEIPAAATGTFVMVLLNTQSQLEQLLQKTPVLDRARLALRRIHGLELDPRGARARELPPSPNGFETIELRGAGRAYLREDGQGLSFRLGPVDLLLRPGEIVFVIGGNGSGKTTFVKMLTSLYELDQGDLLWDGQAVTPASSEAYRQLFAAVFSDFYLFRQLDGHPGNTHVAEAKKFLKLLRLDRSVQVEAGGFSTLALSQGQRKRLALVVAYLDNRPIYLFDEWAADQDPEFKDFFYTVLLPALKAAGKLVIAITHDDKYFDVADRLLKLDEGKLSELPRQARRTAVW